MLKSFVLVVAGVTTGLLCACDPIYGISRSARLPSAPELSCVEAAIHSAPDVENVRSSEQQGGRPVTVTGLKPANRNYYFTYDVGETGASMLLSVDYKGRVEFSQSLISVVRPKIEQWEVDLVRPVMEEIERALEQRCSITDLTMVIKEACSGVDCAS